MNYQVSKFNQCISGKINLFTDGEKMSLLVITVSSDISPEVMSLLVITVSSDISSDVESLQSHDFFHLLEAMKELALPRGHGGSFMRNA